MCGLITMANLYSRPPAERRMAAMRTRGKMCDVVISHCRDKDTLSVFGTVITVATTPDRDFLILDQHNGSYPLALSLAVIVSITPQS